MGFGHFCASVIAVSGSFTDRVEFIRCQHQLFDRAVNGGIDKMDQFVKSDGVITEPVRIRVAEIHVDHIVGGRIRADITDHLVLFFNAEGTEFGKEKLISFLRNVIGNDRKKKIHIPGIVSEFFVAVDGSCEL